MKTTSKITGKTYESTDAIYVANFHQFTAYMANGADEYFLDCFYDRSSSKHKLVFVIERNDFTAQLKRLWDDYALKLD